MKLRISIPSENADKSHGKAMNRAILVTQIRIAILLIVLGSGWRAAIAEPPSDCVSGEESARAQKYAEARDKLDKCLAEADLSMQVRARALKIRAFSHMRLDDYARAVADQEAAIKTGEPVSYGNWINYSLYLRYVGRLKDSLAAVRSAEKKEQESGSGTSMMTQYQLGWALADLKQHEQAIEAYSRGIPLQPDFAFAYWRRGVSYDAIGNRAKAKADFEQAAKLLATAEERAKDDGLMPEVRASLKKYGIEIPGK